MQSRMEPLGIEPQKLPYIKIIIQVVTVMIENEF